jgi:uncharacterized protein (DUF885 family)
MALVMMSTDSYTVETNLKYALAAVQIVAACLAASAQVDAAESAASGARLNALATRYAGEVVDNDPTIVYSTGLTTAYHDRFADRTPEGLAAFAAKEDRDLAELKMLDRAELPATSRAPYAVLREMLEADIQMRVCKTELWNVNHLAGWQSAFADAADGQPVGTPSARAQALKRWSSLPRYVEVEIGNLKRGLVQGYSAPQSVVRRVIAQMDQLSALAPDKSPFYSPAGRDTDPVFRAALARLIADHINPALHRYREYLKTQYLPKARAGVAVSDLPNGEACYQAFLRMNTTLNRSPQAVFDLGRKTVEANQAAVVAIGQRLFGLSDFRAIVARSKSRPENHFRSQDELLYYSRDLLAKAKSRTGTLVEYLPRQDVVIEPERAFEESAGVSSHYDPNPDSGKPGTYRIELGNWRAQTRGDAAITVVHETWPGHHLQIALARQLQPNTPLSQLSFNAAYIEGWARNAEALGEEAGIYDNDDASILRRAWPARGMVVDPGLHAMKWTRQQAVDYMVSSGRFDSKQADDMVDRIAVLPGQLTAYDSGGLEFKALRAEAQAALGAKFDLRRFNTVAIEEGVVPLGELRAHVQAWIKSPQP